MHTLHIEPALFEETPLHRCHACKEILENDYCYVCDGGEYKHDQISFDLRGEHFDVAQYISYVEQDEDTYRSLYE